MIVLTACLVFAGCTALALSQDQKWKAVAGSTSGRARRAIRIVGWVLLGAVLGLGIAVEGPGFAVLLWTLQFALASFVVAMALSFRPGLFKPVARACSVLWPGQ